MALIQGSFQMIAVVLTGLIIGGLLVWISMFFSSKLQDIFD